MLSPCAPLQLRCWLAAAQLLLMFMLHIGKRGNHTNVQWVHRLLSSRTLLDRSHGKAYTVMIWCTRPRQLYNYLYFYYEVIYFCLVGNEWLFFVRLWPWIRKQITVIVTLNQKPITVINCVGYRLSTHPSHRYCLISPFAQVMYLYHVVRLWSWVFQNYLLLLSS